jgi:tRNA (mo5U34)-methyltransferase
MFERSATEDSENVRRWREGLAARKWWHSFELPDGRRIEGVNDIAGLRHRIGLFPIPEDLTGKRVLDIGAWDGWFTFEMERRGAEVMAVDCVEVANFQYLRRELKSKVDYRILDMYDLTPEKLGRFDIVLFLGVLYHLKHPLLGLEKVCALTKGMAAVQTFVSPDTGPPAMEFFETTELGGQFDNWFAPNVRCVLGMCRTAGFARAELVEVNQFSAATVVCYRNFEEPDSSNGTAPELLSCAQMTNYGVNLRSDRDEYVSGWFSSAVEDLNCIDVQARVGAFDSRPVFVGKIGDLWQTNFKLPPGLEPGWHDVRIRAGGGPWSNALRIAIDVPVSTEQLEIAGACDGKTWKPFEVELVDEPVLTLWVSGVPENAGRNEMVIKVGDHDLAADYVGRWEDGKASQVNVSLPAEVGRGVHSVTVAIGGVSSEPVEITCK